MKNFHGLGRAKGDGLKRMTREAKLTEIAVILKRIAKILSSKLLFPVNLITIFFKKHFLSQEDSRIPLKKCGLFSVASNRSRASF